MTTGDKGKIYAQHGYFAEAAETLEQMADLGPLSPEASARQPGHTAV